MGQVGGLGEGGNGSLTMNVPRRHHAIAEMLQRRFTDSDGKLHFFDKRYPDNGIGYTTPSNLFVERDLYAQRDKKGTIDASLETEFMQKIDGAGDQIIEKIVSAARNRTAPQLTTKEKNLWDLFFYYQWVRVPDEFQRIHAVQNFDELLGQLIHAFETTVRPLTDEERRNLEVPAERERIKQNTKVRSLIDAGQEARAILDQKGLGIAVISRPKMSFVIGSSPIVKLTLPGRTHISDPSVEIWLPVAADVAVTPALRSGEERLIQINDSRHVRHINEAIFGQSTVIAGRSKRLISSLATPR